MRAAVGEGRPELHSDLLALAFNRACLSGDLGLASSLLKQLDVVLLGSAMAWEQRETSLKLMRTLRDRLEELRDAARADLAADFYQPQHHLVA